MGVGVLVEALLAGRSAIRTVTRFPTTGLCSALAAEAPGDAVLEALGFPAPPGASRAARLLLAAATEAMHGRSRTPSVRRGVVVGSTKGALELGLAGWRAGRGVRENLLDEPGRRLAEAVGAQGPVFTVGAACASSLIAIGEALALLEDGTCTEVIVGGVDALHPFVYRGFHALKALSPHPAAPFDLHRQGLSLGEGAAVLVLEAAREEEAGQVFISGFAAATDGFDQAAPDPSGQGLIRACRRALAEAGRDPGSVSRYHAHGTGTVQNDRMEAATHAALFEGRAVPVCGIKGSTGHTLGASGALDVVVCAMTLARSVLPPIVQLETVDPAAAVPAVLHHSRPDEGRVALVGSAGFGGINAAVILERSGVAS